MVTILSESQIAKSASDPAAMTPREQPIEFCGCGGVRSTNSFNESRASDCVAENINGSRVSIPGMPLGMFVKTVPGPPAILPQFQGEWSDEKTASVPSNTPRHIAGWLARSRGGGVQTHLAPLMSTVSMSSEERKRYCGQVSRHRQAACLRAPDLFDYAARRHVSDQDRGFDEFRKADRPECRFRSPIAE